jgi:hypothetical protein
MKNFQQCGGEHTIFVQWQYHSIPTNRKALHKLSSLMVLFVSDGTSTFLKFGIKDKMEVGGTSKANVMPTSINVNTDTTSLLDTISVVQLVSSFAVVA